MWAGFKFGLGASLAFVLVMAALQVGGKYSRCASFIDAGQQVPSYCDWVATFHKPKPA